LTRKLIGGRFYRRNFERPKIGHCWFFFDF